MEQLIEELKSLMTTNLYASTVNIAIIIPDVCGALESQDGEASKIKYIDWIEKYVIYKYNFVTGLDFYKLRCASLHQGKFKHDNPNFKKIFFQLSGYPFHGCLIGGEFNLNLQLFCRDIIEGYDKWLGENKTNPNYIKNIASSLQVSYSKGTSIQGMHMLD